MLGINLTSLNMCVDLAGILSTKGYSLASNAERKEIGIHCSLELNTDLKLYRYTEYNPDFYNWLRSDVEATKLVPDEALAHYLNPNQKENTDLNSRDSEFRIHSTVGFSKRIGIW